MMKIRDITKLQDSLHEALYSLVDVDINKFGEDVESKEASIVDEYASKFKAIYVKGFRHQYSSLYDLVAKIAQGGDSDIDAFQAKLESILMRLDEQEPESDVRKSFFKLCDHLSLEMRRWQEATSLEGRIETLGTQLQEDEEKASEARKKIDETEERISKIQTDFVAILAIFAAVVIAFSSGSEYVLKSIDAVGKAPLDVLVSMALVCGLVLTNALFMLMYFIGRIIGRGLDVKWWIVLVFNTFVILLILLTRCTPFFTPDSLVWWP